MPFLLAFTLFHGRLTIHRQPEDETERRPSSPEVQFACFRSTTTRPERPKGGHRVGRCRTCATGQAFETRPVAAHRRVEESPHPLPDLRDALEFCHPFVGRH